MMWRHTVVLPEPSGPKTSTILPRGMPPTPSAMSRASEPVGVTVMPCPAGCSPSFMTAPLPNCFSICERVTSSILSRSILKPPCALLRAPPSPFDEPPDELLDELPFRPSCPSGRRTLTAGYDTRYTAVIRRGARSRSSQDLEPGRDRHPLVRKRYPNICSGSTTSGLLAAGERMALHGLVDGGGAAEMAPVQDDPLDSERRRTDVLDGGHVLGELHRGLRSGDGEMRGEGSFLRLDDAGEAQVERSRERGEPSLRVLAPDPPDPRPPRARERAGSGRSRDEGSLRRRDGRDRAADALHQSRPDGAQELDRDVPVLLRDPAEFRVARPEWFETRHEPGADVTRDVDGDEEPPIARLRAGRAISPH